MFLEMLEVGRGRVAAARRGGEELVGEEAEVVADGEHAARRLGRGRLGEDGRHGIEEREGERDAGAAEEPAAGHGPARGDVWKSHGSIMG